MTLIAITTTGKRHVFNVAFSYLVPAMLKLIIEPVAGYTLVNGDEITDVEVHDEKI